MSTSKAIAKELSTSFEDENQGSIVKDYYELDKKIDFILEKITKRKKLKQTINSQ